MLQVTVCNALLAFVGIACGKGGNGTAGNVSDFFSVLKSDGVLSEAMMRRSISDVGAESAFSKAI